jgi:hypothetical protein
MAKLLYWLVVSPPLKNISQIGASSQLLKKIKHVPNHQPRFILGKTKLPLFWMVYSSEALGSVRMVDQNLVT